MFYWLFYETLYPLFSPLRLFGYVTFRTALASLTALAMCIFLGPAMIAWLRRLSIGQHIREDGPTWHEKKAGTPTMGGVLIIVSVIVPTLLFADLSNPQVWVALFSLLTFGLIGFHDDYSKISKRQNLGLTARSKFTLQILAALVLGVLLSVMHFKGLYTTAMNVPFFKQFKPDLLIVSLLHQPVTYPLAFVFFYGFLVLVVVGSANAVNLTDGLDGLAIGLDDYLRERDDGARLRKRPRGLRLVSGALARARRP